MTNEKFLILEASAGSGKTHNLAKRYITLLLNFDISKNQKVPLKNILALTFTNKATVEMKERIIEYLKKISLGKDTENITDSIALPKKHTALNAAAAMEAIIYDYDKFNVNTIDSFINLVIKACALKIGFSPDYSICEGYDKYLDSATESFLDNSLTNENKKLLDKFFCQYITDSHSSWDIKQNITERFKNFYKKDRNINTDIPDINYDETLLNYSRKFYEYCSEMIKIKEFENVNKTNAKSLKNINTTDYLLKNDKLSTFFEKEEVPYNKNTEHNNRLDDLFIETKKILKDFIEFKAEHFYDNYIKIFSNIISEFNKKAKEDSVMFLQNMNKKIEDIFTDNEQSMSLNEVYCRLSDRFTDLLIDEFQDTNELQWKAIKPIAEENLSQNGSFFYVGDKKQAIYGFRGGDSAIFNIPLKEFISFNPKMITLDINYRSCKAVIDMNNEVFSPENLDSFIKTILEKEKFSDINKEYYNDIIETFKTSRQQYSGKKEETGYIEIQRKYTSADTTDEKESNEDIIKEYLYKTIESVKERFDYKNIAVLCRKAADIEKVGKWLLDKGINIESYVTLNILRSDIVKEIFSLLKFLANPEDKISFVSFITGKIFLKHTGLSSGVIDEFILKNKNSKFLYIAFRENFKDIWDKNLEPFFNSAGFIAVYELTVAFISKYKVIENFPEYSNIILRFLEIINIFINKENENHSLQKFTEFFSDFEKNEKDDSFFVKVPSSNAVKIITVHKAKGLQFDVVIMPYFYIDTKSPKPPYDDNGNFLYFNKSHIKYSQKLKDIYAKTFFKSVFDELNTIYVAMTRAVYEFHGLIVEKENTEPENKKSSISYLIPESLTSKGEKVKVIKKGTEKYYDEITLNSDNLKDITEILTESTVEIYGKNKAEMLLKGEIFHYAMANIISFNTNNKQTVIEKALELTKLQYPDEDLSDITIMINNLLSVKDTEKLFSEKYKIYNEQEFIDSFGNTIRPDKLIITDSEIIILDYKTSMYDEESIKEQMHRYINAVREVWKNKPVKAFIADIQKCILTEIQ